jgi:hypothetical protein
MKGFYHDLEIAIVSDEGIIEYFPIEFLPKFKSLGIEMEEDKVFPVNATYHAINMKNQNSTQLQIPEQVLRGVSEKLRAYLPNAVCEQHIADFLRKALIKI